MQTTRNSCPFVFDFGIRIPKNWKKYFLGFGIMILVLLRGFSRKYSDTAFIMASFHTFIKRSSV